MITTKMLISLKNGDRFVHGPDTYTVFQHEGNMTEVFKNGRFWAWPNWNGKAPVTVNFLS